MARAGSWRASVCLLLATLAGCGASSVTKPVVVTPLVELGVVQRSAGAGPDVAAISRPGGELLQLALFVDAGSRDADPPQVAALAAWLAADAAGNGVIGHAWPDGIELSLSCPKSQLERCLASLAAALSLRAVDATRWAEARARLADARRRALAADPSRDADRLALEALYGERGGAFLPLGRAEDDERAGVDAVRALLADAFGPRRALLIAAGDVEPGQLSRSAASAFAKAPAARQPASSRSAAALPKEQGGLLVGVDRNAALSLAIASENLQRAEAAASELRERLLRERLASAVRGHTFIARGAALALLRVQTTDPEAALRASAHEIELLRAEGTASTAQRTARDDLAMLARRLGMRWIARAEPSRAPLALGAGVLVAGGRGDSVKLDDPDEPRRRTAQSRFENAFEAGRAAAEPRTSGSKSDTSASLVLDSGARLELRKRGGDQLAVAVRFGCGAGGDPPLWHGRAALLAVLGTTACAGLEPEELTQRLHTLGAELAPRVDAESLGLLLTAPAASFGPALDLALACALHPTIDRQALAAARLKLKQRIGPTTGARELAAIAAQSLAPTTPGALAPWGSGIRQASVGLPALQELSARCRRGATLAASVVGPVAIDELADRVARRVALLPVGRGGEETPPQQTSAPPTPAVPDQPTLGVVVWRAQMSGADPAGGRGFAALMRASANAMSPGVSTTWHDGGATSEVGWAALAVSGPPAELAAFAAELGKGAQSVPPASLDRAVEAALDQSARAETQRSGSAASEAESLARAPFHPATATHDREAAHALATRLAQAQPLWIPLR
jgi:predicted Zn-dependent peptidase